MYRPLEVRILVSLIVAWICPVWVELDDNRKWVGMKFSLKVFININLNVRKNLLKFQLKETSFSVFYNVFSLKNFQTYLS